MSETNQTKLHSGGCHCGKVRFQAEVDTSNATACNCSICSRMGWLLTFVPESKFTLLSGGDELTDYQFGKKHIHHLFCRTCGVNSFSRGKAPNGQETFAVNLRCLDDVDVAAVNVKHFDGKKL